LLSFRVACVSVTTFNYSTVLFLARDTDISEKCTETS